MAGVRIAVLADIHGNLAALDAVLADVERVGVDRVYVLGDVINGGPEPEACWHAVRDRADGVLKGNHERYVLSARAGDPRFHERAWGPALWTARRMDAADLAAIAELPATLPLDAGPPGGTLLCHASPRRDDDPILPDTPDEAVRPMVAGVGYSAVIRGHNHVSFERAVDGVRIVALGSVGLPFLTPPRAEYAVLEEDAAAWRVRRRTVAYDVDATLRACRETGYLDGAGPVARLFAAEIATGERHLSAFMRDRAAADGPAPLDAAVDRFLAARLG